MENALRSDVLGDICVYVRTPRSPQHGAAGRRCGFVATWRAGAQSVGPPTYRTASLLTTRALDSLTYLLMISEYPY